VKCTNKYAAFFVMLSLIIGCETLPAYFDTQFEKQDLGLQYGYAGVGIKKMRIS